MLPSELATIHSAITQTPPKQRLGIGGLVTKVAGEFQEIQAVLADLMTDAL